MDSFRLNYEKLLDFYWKIDTFYGDVKNFWSRMTKNTWKNDAALDLRGDIFIYSTGEYIYLFMCLLFSNSIIELIDKESRTSSSIPWYHV